MFEELDGAVSARMTSAGIKDNKRGATSFTRDRNSPLRQKTFRRIGVGAALDVVEGTCCVVVYLGR